MLRTDSPKKVRLAGMIPGVLNESDLTSTSVQFMGPELNKIVSRHGPNAKLWVDLGTEKKFGFIKEIQKSVLDRKIIHIAIQLVSQDQEVKLELPIVYHGKDELEHKFLQIQVYKAEVEVTGKTVDMPDSITVDVSMKEAGDTITSAELNLPAAIKLHDTANEIYAVIKAAKKIIEEEPAEEVTPA